MFRLRAVVVGSTAFQCYGPMLGFRIPRQLGQTNDLDIAQFLTVSIAVDDRIDDDFLTVLRRANPRFREIPSPMDLRRTSRYAVQAGGQTVFSVDVLAPLRGPERKTPTPVGALRGDKQLLRFLDFLIYREVEAVALHGLGILIRVPTPERYAFHKLIVSQRRLGSSQGSARAQKDLPQASTLLQ